MKKIGEISLEIATILQLNVPAKTPLYIGESNISHMKSEHFKDYMKYNNQLKYILEDPDYIGKNPKDNSIEYVKNFIKDNEYVKVAVRISNNKLNYYVRSLYVLNNKRVNNFIKKGTLIKLNNNIK